MRLFFQLPPGIKVRNRAKLGHSAAIDVRGNGGLLVLPPSRHKSGHQVSWVDGRAPSDVSPRVISSQLVSFIVGPVETHDITTTTRVRSVVETPEPSVSNRVAFVLRANAHLRALWEGRGKRLGDCSRSGYDFSFACELLARRVPVSEVVAAIEARAGNHRTQPGYAAATVAAALKNAGRS